MPNQPIRADDLAPFSGPQTYLRLPAVDTPEGLDVAVIGVPLEGGGWRNGARTGPRSIREHSAMIRPVNPATGAAPFAGLNVGDLGDVAINAFSLADSLRIVNRSYDRILGHSLIPLTLGGDRTLSLPVLLALARAQGPVALIQIDAHANAADTVFGMREVGGTVLRRAVEEGLILPDRSWAIGLRGSADSAAEFRGAADLGLTLRPAHGLWHQSLAPLAAEILARIGETPTYISLDLDALDPAHAPGVGQPEIGGLSTAQMLELIRGLRGLRIVGADVVNLSPPHDPAGITAMTAASLMFEILSILPGVPCQ